MVDLILTLEIISAVAMALIAYNIYTKFKQGKTIHEVPEMMNKPIVLTKSGLSHPDKVIEKPDGTMQVIYTDGHYQNYNRTDLLPLNGWMENFRGKTQVYIEYDMALNIVYTTENKNLRKYLKAELEDAIKNNRPTVIKELLEELRRPVERMEDIKDEFSKAQRKATKNESDLRKLEAGTEGRLQRRAEPIIEVASKRASTAERKRIEQD